MRLYDVEEQNLMNDDPIPDKPLNTFGNNEKPDVNGWKI
jgi:hypothetical protein